MMLILMLIMMLKFFVKESSNLIGLENFGAAGFFKFLVDKIFAKTLKTLF